MSAGQGESSWAATAARQPVFLAGGEGVLELVCGFFESPMPPAAFADMLSAFGIARPFVVAGSHFESYRIKQWLDDSGCAYQVYSDFTSNPTYEQTLAATDAFRASGCDALISVGGGSAIDVAKCAQAFSGMEGDGVGSLYTEQEVPDVLVPHIALPTTAGTGSESTHFAVVYVDGKKHSLADHRLLPTAAVLDPTTLSGLPDYHKRSALLDALCQAIESWWSVRSCEESRAFSQQAISAIMQNAEAYLSGDSLAAKEAMVAANLAGGAINLTTTTAAHALSYKLSSLYGIAHGHAVALCMVPIWNLLVERGGMDVRGALTGIAQSMTGDSAATAEDGPVCFTRLLSSMGFDPVAIDPSDISVLVGSVNVQRLANHPLELSSLDIEAAYLAI